jgi:sugar lactone lactonase YvrE
MKIPYLRHILFFAFLSSFILLNTGCSKKSSTTVNANIPLVTTTGVIIGVTATTAQSGGILVNAENGTVTVSGVCYSSTNTVPTTADSKTTDSLKDTGSSLKSFTSNLTGLTANTTYYLRAYCTNEAGVGYGGVLTFKTTGNTMVTATVSTFAGTGTQGYLDGPLTSAMFNNPQGVTVDASGNLYVSDSFNDVIRKLTSAGTSTIAGNQIIGFVNGSALNAEFYAPNGQAFDAQGNLYVADFGNNVIRKITPAGVVSTYAGTGVAGYRNGAKDSANYHGSTDSLAVFNNPEGVAVDAAGNVYVADRGNNVIREILTTGRTKTVAGNRVKGFIDATDAAAFFDNPTGVAVDSKGNLYVTDQGNSALRKITSAGVVTTLAGNPVQTALLNFPSAITIDANGNLFMADEGGRIMEYNSAGVLYYLAGALNSSGFVNGDGSTARFNYPQGIAVDASGNIYVADQYNNCIRQITLTTSNVAAVRKNKVTIR